jgi:hypothetical protein
MKLQFRIVYQLVIAGMLSLATAQAQDAIVQEGEFGFGVGAGHYFGDLNTRANLLRPSSVRI